MTDSLQPRFGLTKTCFNYSSVNRTLVLVSINTDRPRPGLEVGVNVDDKFSSSFLFFFVFFLSSVWSSCVCASPSVRPSVRPPGSPSGRVPVTSVWPHHPPRSSSSSTSAPTCCTPRAGREAGQDRREERAVSAIYSSFQSDTSRWVFCRGDGTARLSCLSILVGSFLNRYQFGS